MKTTHLLSISVSHLRQSISVVSLSSGFRIKRFKLSKFREFFFVLFWVVCSSRIWLTFWK